MKLKLLFLRLWARFWPKKSVRSGLHCLESTAIVNADDPILNAARHVPARLILIVSKQADALGGESCGCAPTEQYNERK